MYFGAVLVLDQPGNPERLAQCAHSIRELLEKLPRFLDVPTPAEEARLDDKVQALRPAWEKVTADPTWKGDEWVAAIDERLRSFLKRTREFFAWYDVSRPRARKRTATVLRGLDPTGRPMPPAIEELRVREWIEYRDYFVKVAHHGTQVDDAEFSSWLGSLEGFLLDRLRPRTFDDQEDIRRIVQEAENADS